MIKTHVIHVLVDGQNQEHIKRFETLVDKFVDENGARLRGEQFFVTPMSNKDAVRMTAIFSYNDGVLP